MDSSSNSMNYLLLSGFMGLLGGILTIPINAIFSYLLKRDELLYQHKLDLIAKQRELLLEHELELKRLEIEKRQKSE